MKRREKRSMVGFTLIELLVVVVIIGILAAIALPNFIGVQAKAKEASTKANMRTVQIAAESYSTDNGGTYDAQVDTALESYFPGGGSDGTTVGNPPINPFVGGTGNWSDYTSITSLSAITNVAAERATTGLATGSPGQIAYSGITPTGGAANSSYAIEGIGSTSKAIQATAGSVLCLSNM